MNLSNNYNNINIKTTDDVINLIESQKNFDTQNFNLEYDSYSNRKLEKICILTHPERWSKNLFEWIGYFTFDKGVQGFKVLRGKF